MRTSKGRKVEVFKIGVVYDEVFFQAYKKDGGVNVLVSSRYICEILVYVHVRLYIFEFGIHMPIVIVVKVH